MTTQLGGMVLRDWEEEEEEEAAAPTRKSRRREACERPATPMRVPDKEEEEEATVPWVPSKAMRGTRVHRAATMMGIRY